MAGFPSLSRTLESVFGCTSHAVFQIAATNEGQQNVIESVRKEHYYTTFIEALYGSPFSAIVPK